MSRINNLTVISALKEESTLASSIEDNEELDDLDLKIDESDLSDEVDLPKGDCNEKSDSLVTKSENKGEIDIDEHVPERSGDESEDLETVEKELDLLLMSENDEKSVDTDSCSLKEKPSVGNSENSDSTPTEPQSTVKDVKLTETTAKDVKLTESTDKDTKLTESTVKDVELTVPTVKDAELTKSTVKNAELIKPTVKDAELTKPTVKDAESTKSIVKNVELTKPTVKDAELTKPTVKDAELTKSTVKNAELIKPTVKDAELTKPTVKDAESTKSIVKNVELTKPTVKDAELTKPTVKDAESTKSTVKNAVLTKPIVKDAELTKPTVKDAESTKSSVKDVQNVEKLVDKGGGAPLEAAMEMVISANKATSISAKCKGLQEKPPSSDLVSEPVRAPVEGRKKDVLDVINKRSVELTEDESSRKKTRVEVTEKKGVTPLINGFRKKVTKDIAKSVKGNNSSEQGGERAAEVAEKDVVEEKGKGLSGAAGGEVVEAVSPLEVELDAGEDKENLPARERLFTSYFSKKPAVTVNRELMEEMLMVRVVDYLASKSDVAQLRQRCKFLENEQTRLIKLTNGLKKHVEDAKHIIRKLIDEKMNSQTWTNSIVPLRVTRSVGLQVCTCGSETVTEALLKEVTYVRPRRSGLNKKPGLLSVLNTTLQKPVLPRADAIAALNGITPTSRPYSSNTTQVIPNAVVSSPNTLNNIPDVLNNSALSVSRVNPTNGLSPLVTVSTPGGAGTTIATIPGPPRTPTEDSPLSRSGEMSGGKRPQEEARPGEKSATSIEIDLTSRAKENGARKPPISTIITTPKPSSKKPHVEEIIDLTEKDEVQTNKRREITITKSSPASALAVKNAVTPNIIRNSIPSATPSPNSVSSPNRAVNNSSVMPSMNTAAKKTVTEPAPLGAKRPSTELAQNSAKISRIAPIGADLLESQGQLPKFPSQPRYPLGTPRPPRPILRIGIKNNSGNTGIMLSWTFGDNNKNVANIDLYQLYAFQESSKQGQEPSENRTETWKKVGDIKALPLPMACFLTQFLEGNKYHFIVRAVDFQKRIGDFSLPGSIVLQAKSNEDKSTEAKSRT